MSWNKTRHLIALLALAVFLAVGGVCCDSGSDVAGTSGNGEEEPDPWCEECCQDCLDNPDGDGCGECFDECGDCLEY
ncbi:MAG: hypothetical protein KAW17_04110, partial [Candidatus Eisenbacteria sp.]|nr:hypothetical protein [Candidatus Eisenbacteria bacterium]